MDTGGRCRTLDCYGFRGATCTDGQCLCPAGQCSVFGICRRYMGTLSARVAPVNAEQPAFPDEQGRVVTALVLSGGGTRSQVASLGVLRALESLGLMGSVDAISAVSGGSWAAAPYVFAHMDPSELLGAETVPADLTLQELSRTPCPLGRTATAGTTRIATDLAWHGMPPQHLWIYTIGRAILEPFGLDDMTAYMASDAAAVQRIRHANPQLRNATFFVPRQGTPRTLVMSGTILAPTGYQAAAQNVVSLQMSPDFSGSPFYPDGGRVRYGSESGRPNDELAEVVGGGFVETFAFGGLTPFQESGGKTVRMPAPLEPLSLAKAVGISSAGPASALTQVGPHGSIDIAALNPRSNFWPVMDGAFAGEQQPAATYTVGDGGNIDNSGLLAMLQRGAQKIVWLVNTGKEVPPSPNFCRRSHLIESEASLVDSQLSDKFGYWTQDDLGEFLTHNQVFDPSELPRLLCDLQRLSEVGRPLVVMRQLQVLENRWWGIPGGNEVSVLFVYNGLVSEFVAQLPEETQASIQRGALGDFARFPHYWPVFQNLAEATALTDKQVNLLAAQSEYVVRRTAALFRMVLEPGS